MFDFEPVTEINGWKGHQTALDLSQPRKLLGSAHPRLVSCEPGRERSSIFGLQFCREQSSRVTTFGEGTACGADRTFGQICPSSRKLLPSFGQPQLNGGARMFEKFTRHLSRKENDGAKTGESFKIATPGSSLDHAPTRPDRLAVEATGNHKVSEQRNYDTPSMSQN